MMKKSVYIKAAKKIAAAFMMFSLIIVMTACQGSSSKKDKNTFMVCYTDQSANDIIYKEQVVPDADKMEQIEVVEALLDLMFKQADASGEFYSAKPEDVDVDGINIKDGLINLDFNKNYLRMTNVKEIILKASVVLTLIQVPGVLGVSFSVEGSPITDSTGEAIGNMTKDSFVNVLLNEEGMLKQEIDAKVYFANEDGTRLVSENYVFTIDNSSSSIEEYILAKLIAGPEDPAHNRTIAADVAVNSVVTTEGVCHVNFSKSFIEQNQPVNDEIMIYSIVDSLCELTYVHSVNFMVEGDSNILLHGNMDLSEPLVRDRTYIEDES